MEASEKPQLPLEPPAGEGSVRLVEDRLVIEDLTVADEQTARVVRERAAAGEEPARAVRRAIEIGARVLDREDTAVEVDYVRREFEHLQVAHRETVEQQNRDAVERIEQNLQKALGDDEAPGALGAALDSHSGEIAEMIAETFGDDREGAVQAQIKRILEQRDEEFMRRLAAEDESNPLGPMLANLRRWTKERKDDQDSRDEKLGEKVDELIARVAELTGIDQGREAVEEAEQAGTRKGRSFEERVNDSLEEIAARRGDAALAVGDAANESGSKKGDTLVEVGGGSGRPSCRIVFEAKNRKLGKPDAWRELNAALAERDAGFAVLVVAGEEKIPPKTQTLHEYEGNKMIVAVDPEEPESIVLETAYMLARARLTAVGESDLSVDASGVRAAASEALMSLRDRQKISKSLTAAKGNVSNAQEVLDGMTDRVRDRLEQIQKLVSDAADEAEGA